MSKKIIICKNCKGHGIRYWDKLTDYHKSEYSTYSKDCPTCDGRGVLMEITTVKTRALKEQEYKPCQNHNGEYKYER